MRTDIPTARDVMIRRLVTLRPDMRAEEVAGILLEHNISGASVVDEDGNLVGLVSEYDCLQAVAAAEYDYDNHDLVLTAEEMMTRAMFTIPPEMDLFAIAHEFVTHRVRRFPVVEGGHLIGQVSRRDVLRAAYELRRKLLRGKHYPDYPEGRAPIRDYPRRR